MRKLFLIAAAFTAFAPGVRADERSFDSNGVKIAYLDEGKGETVVLLHGFTLSATEMWGKSPSAMSPFFSGVAKAYRVIAPDLRGHGKSDKPHDPKKYGKEMAEDVVRLLDHLKVKKAHVVGYSMGAWVAGTLLVTHPDRLSSATFGGSGPLFRPSKQFLDRFEATAASLEKGNGIAPLILAGAADGGAKLTPEQAAAVSKLVLGDKDQKALAAVLRGMDGMEVAEEKLMANAVPVQFVYGGLEGKANVDLMTGAVRRRPRTSGTGPSGNRSGPRRRSGPPRPSARSCRTTCCARRTCSARPTRCPWPGASSQSRRTRPSTSCSTAPPPT